MTQVTLIKHLNLGYILYDLLLVINPLIQLQIRVMIQNSAYGHFEGQGRLDHMTPRWTCFVIVVNGISLKS